MVHPSTSSPKAGQLRTASKLKIQVARVACSPVSGRIIASLTRNRIHHHGLRFDVEGPEFSAAVKAQMFWGSYEGTETRFIRKFLQGSETVVELGSSLGITTAHAAAVMAPTGRLICVEANRQLLPGIRKRIEPYSASLEVDILHAAITEHCGVTTLAVARETMSSRLTSPFRSPDRTMEVPALTLQEVLRRSNVTEFDLISDIEGAEAAFLVQDQASLSACRRAVIELHDTDVDNDVVSITDLAQGAISSGFRISDSYGPVVAFTRS